MNLSRPSHRRASSAFSFDWDGLESVRSDRESCSGVVGRRAFKVCDRSVGIPPDPS